MAVCCRWRMECVLVGFFFFLSLTLMWWIACVWVDCRECETRRPCRARLHTAISTHSPAICICSAVCCMLYNVLLYAVAVVVFSALVVFELKTCIKAPIDGRFINSSFPNESEVTSYHWFFDCNTRTQKTVSFVLFNQNCFRLKHFCFCTPKKFVYQITYSRWVFH